MQARAFRVTADLDTATICNCSICTKKGIIHLIVPPERFELVGGKDNLTADTLNRGIAKHMFCKVFGMHPFYVPRSDPDEIDANARYVDTIDLSAFRPKYFDDMNWERAMGAKVPWR